MPRIDLDAVPQTNATGYPAPYSNDVQNRFYRRLAPATGITDFGASHVVLKPGGWSGQRHWHEGEDELVVMIAGEAVLIDDNGRTTVGPGDVLAFPKGDGNAHHLVNESEADCVFVAIGKPSSTDCHYPDIDMHLSDGAYRRRDGTPY
ncbi:cupin domain-containing protein [Sphingomonas montanisoli]|uniref:Cupin domain-containing protein n=1 Tax=Sphingomonas montanisoli TaxID=2606412 RepID=A0A5D9CGI3_9SPHN|nr:cupin domain-containing protein [Sphingomonas montanisoli]TZG29175.1 cupin domain-containing protein [Sphingomonas montanisoli]